MEHRGGCGGDSDSGDGAGILCSIPWGYLEEKMNLKNTQEFNRGLGMVFMPNKKEKTEICKSICDEEAEKLKINKTSWRTCLLYTSPSPRDRQKSRMPSSA